MSAVRTEQYHSGEDDLPIVNAPFRFWRGAGDDVRAMVAQRELMRSFVARELRQRYKGSFLGWGWALVRPLVMLAVYGVAVGVFLGANKSVPEFAVYLYTGLVAWGFFSAIITGSISTLPANSGLINKANFQRELLVAAVVVVAVIDLLIQMSVLVVGFLAYGAWPSLGMLWWIVPGFLVILLIGLGLGLVLSAANVYFRDVGYFAEVALQIGFWVVPILYAYSMVQRALADYPGLLALYTANPLTSAITAFRYGLWPAATTPAGEVQLMPADQVLTILGLSAVGALILIWLAQRYFARVSGNLAQEL
jgi:ABC-2 type transport system permease protein